MTKFKNEVESVHSLLLADNERLTEVRDGLQSRVDQMKELVQSSIRRSTLEMTTHVDSLEKNVERRKIWLQMQREAQQKAAAQHHEENDGYPE